MNDTKISMGLQQGQHLAKPLHIQRLEASLDMTSFMSYAQNLLSRPLTSSDDSDSDVNSDSLNTDDKVLNGIISSKKDRHTDKMHVFNFSQLDTEREWLKDILITDSDTETEYSNEDDYIQDMLRNHQREFKLRKKYYKDSNNAQFAYYGTGLLSNFDAFLEHQRSIIGLRRKKRERERKSDTSKSSRSKKLSSNMQQLLKKEPDDQDGELNDGDWDEHILKIKEEIDDGLESKPQSPNAPPTKSNGRQRKKGTQAKTPEVMAARRKKVWQLMAKKELGKIQRAKVNNHKEMLTSCKRVASFCLKISRQKAMQSQKNMKETVWRAKRLTREMQGYWKRYDRVERETRRRMEKEAEEQRKMDVELIEAKRQQRKLNFLITQTELYAHFMSKKLGHGTEEEQLRILNQLDEEMNPRLAAIDDYDSEAMKQKAQKNASEAFNTDTARTKQFDMMAQAERLSMSIDNPGFVEYPQPDIFKGILKGYQLKGMTWLANLYDQGISGILADEMGLGKTVQSIAFLCHIAERYGVWGPFLIISPASTLHNWQQEMQRFIPDFNVVPYWGSPNERKILRQFWEQKDLHTKDASFHVVITSYQLVVSDYKYFNRIKWQYMILDEAQAIKSSSSVRWKLLLGFNCRNRLLLSGTPIQNSMAELWALLHFIMPTLFDSHDEFNEWFSKDIESHAENKTGIDEKQISRLHMILKPFMLRRIKKDVENELSDKIEIMVYCPLTTRQKLLYMALKKKIRIEDLLQISGVGGDGHIVDKNFTSNLMNLVMQFRKVCNHPELFERRDAKSPFSMKCVEYIMPRLVFEDGLLYRSFPSKRHLLYNKLNIFKAENIHRSLNPITEADKLPNYPTYVDLNLDSTFSFTRFCALSSCEVENLALGGIIYFLQHCSNSYEYLKLLNQISFWSDNGKEKNIVNAILLAPTYENKLNKLFFSFESIFKNLIFTSLVTAESSIYAHVENKICFMPESMEHRIIRSKNNINFNIFRDDLNIKTEIKEETLDDDVHVIKSPLKSPTGTTSFAKSPLKSPNTGHVKSPLKSPGVIALSHSKTVLTSPVSSVIAKPTHSSYTLLPEIMHRQKKSIKRICPTEMPAFVYGHVPKVQTSGKYFYCENRSAQWALIRHNQCENKNGLNLVNTGLEYARPIAGWSNIAVPDKQTLVSDAGKLSVLDGLLTRLKAHGHRVLIYSQMTKMIDLLEEYMWHRKYRYMRLDGSSKISARRDMVADFQTRADIFVFLLSTRAGGLGINLTAADTVIFYDSDWNPTVDQQAMDRAHRLGQTKQVTVYRLICKGTIEERILQRAREKSEIQRMVISGGNFKPDTLKPKEVVSLLLDDEEIKTKYRQKTEEKNSQEEYNKIEKEKEKKRKQTIALNKSNECVKKQRVEFSQQDYDDFPFLDTNISSPVHSETSHDSNKIIINEQTSVSGIAGIEESSNEALIVDCDSPGSNTPVSYSSFDMLGKPRRRHHPRGTRRGRPRGSRRGGGFGTIGRSESCGGGGGGGNIASSSVTPTSQSATSGTNSSSGGDPAATTTALTSSITPETIQAASQSSLSNLPMTPMRRGPGRPRLKPNGPCNQGFRGTPRPRKPIGPLVVPLGQSPAATPLVRSPAISPSPSPAPDKSGIGFYQQMDEDS